MGEARRGGGSSGQSACSEDVGTHQVNDSAGLLAEISTSISYFAPWSSSFLNARR